MNTRKILYFILISSAFSWIVAFVLSLLPEQANQLTVKLIFSVLFMLGPAVAVLLLQLTPLGEPLKSYGLVLKNISVPWLLKTSLIYFFFLLITFATIALFGNTLHLTEFGLVHFDQTVLQAQLNNLAQGLGQPVPTQELPSLVILLQALIIQALIAGYTINMVVSMGEEIGWRGFLLKETQRLGFWKSNLLIGIIWGLWHWPLIYLGHNYPNYPILGIGMMVLFCTALSFPLAYIRLKTKTLIGPAAFHGMINASSGITLLLITEANELYGSLAGLAGVIAGLLVTTGIALLDPAFIKEYKNLSNN